MPKKRGTKTHKIYDYKPGDPNWPTIIWLTKPGKDEYAIDSCEWIISQAFAFTGIQVWYIRSLAHDTTGGVEDDFHITVFASHSEPSSKKEVEGPFDYDGHLYVDVDEETRYPYTLLHPDNATTTDADNYPIQLRDRKGRSAYDNSLIPDTYWGTSWPGLAADDEYYDAGFEYDESGTQDDTNADTSQDNKRHSETKDSKKSKDTGTKRMKKRRGRPSKKTAAPGGSSSSAAIRVQPTLTKSGRLTFPYTPSERGKVVAEYDSFEYDDAARHYYWDCKTYGKRFIADTLPPKKC